jgi:hypothetical protein
MLLSFQGCEAAAKGGNYGAHLSLVKALKYYGFYPCRH